MQKQRRSAGALAWAVFIVAVTMAVVPLRAGQAPASNAGVTTSTQAPKPAGKWLVPKTPWGDPDLQGLWPSIDMQGTPYERPPELAGKALLDDEEFAARAAAQGGRPRGWGEQG